MLSEPSSATLAAEPRYARLSQPQPGLAGAINARAEAHTIRLALIYALIDGAPAIASAHLQAALAIADYAARSATWALARSTHDPLASDILSALAHSTNGMTRTQIRDPFHRNQPANRVDHALSALAHDAKITSTRILTGGRPADLWTATTTIP